MCMCVRERGGMGVQVPKEACRGRSLILWCQSYRQLLTTQCGCWEWNSDATWPSFSSLPELGLRESAKEKSDAPNNNCCHE